MEKLMRNPDIEIGRYVEIVKNTLYFAVLKGAMNKKLRNTGDCFYFSVDDEFVYQNYYSDFGPLNVSCLYKYCTKLTKYLQYARGMKNIVHYTTNNAEKKTNAACLVASFCIIFFKMSPKDVFTILEDAGPFKPFLDASQYPHACPFNLKLRDVLQAVFKAVTFNFINLDDFNVTEYDLYNKLEFGDMNWLVPRKFLAFIGPTDNRTVHPPEFYIKYFLKNDVKTVIRLNNILYDSYAFLQVGIQHFDLIFPDGTTPPKDILLKFLYIAETAPAAIAVHCKAGLGRTGSLIGAFLIKHYRMTAREAIAWLRLCRPGSVIGQQQLWLEQIQSWLWRTGSQYRVQRFGEGDKIPRHKYGIYSKQWPIDREKIIREARKQIQSSFTKKQLESISNDHRCKSLSADKILDNVTPKMYAKNAKSFKSISKLISTMHCENKKSLPKHSFVNVKSSSGVQTSKHCDLGYNSNKKSCLKTQKQLSDKEKKESVSQMHSKKHFMLTKSGETNQGDRLNEIKLMHSQKTRSLDRCQKSVLLK